MRKLNGLALALTLGATAAGTAASAAEILVTMNPANPPHYLGGCPGAIKFTGSIMAKGVTEVKYQWFRSDGAKGPVQTLVYHGTTRLPISDTWTLGGIPALPSYAGWEAVHILSPARPDSAKAYFDLRCVQRAAPPPRK